MNSKVNGKYVSCAAFLVILLLALSVIVANLFFMDSGLSEEDGITIPYNHGIYLTTMPDIWESHYLDDNYIYGVIPVCVNQDKVISGEMLETRIFFQGSKDKIVEAYITDGQILVTLNIWECGPNWIDVSANGMSFQHFEPGEILYMVFIAEQ